MNSYIIRFSLIVVALLVYFNFSAFAQGRIGSVQGTIQDPTGAIVEGASVTIRQSVTGYNQTAKTDAQGSFRLVNVPFNTYSLRVEAAGFQIGTQTIDVESAAPSSINFSLVVAAANATVDVTSDAGSALVESDKTSSDTDISQTLLERPVGASPSRGIESIVASVPGFAPDDNGRLHPRGSESQVQYVIDGVPITDNLSAIFSTSLDARTLRTVEVLTGGIPAEFGDKLAGVVNVNTRSGLEQPTSGGVTLSGGSFSTGEFGADFSTRTKKLGFLANVSATTTRRFLDPPTIENFNNLGRSAKGFFRFDYRFDDKNSIRATLLIGGSNFHVPNRLAQENNGQDQRQRNRDDSVFISYERVFSPTVFGQFSFFNRYGNAKLTSNAQSTPVAAFQDRTLQNTGGIAGISVVKGKNTFKFGGQLTVTPVRENFSFYPTARFADLIDENGNPVPNPVNNFTAANPFVFNGRRTGRTFGFYAQDKVSPFKNFTIDAGVRYDNYRLIIRDSGFSPRVGIAYFIPRTGTTLRASYNRFFQTPPSENLLLASSAQAAALSPLAVLQNQTGVRPILPDKQNVFEIGVQQQATKYLRLNLTAYQKRITNFGDKDQFFDTGVIFPITISKGRVTGEELRLETAEVKGFSGFLSYANARAFGITPINGGLFLGESAAGIQNQGLRFANDHDQRNSAQFQVNYTDRRSGIYTIFGGRYDSGYPTDVEPGTTLAEFTADGFDPRLYRKIDFERGRVRPRTVFNLSVGADLLRKERTSLNVQLDVQNVANKLFLYNFESVFSGTHIGFPRIISGRIGLRFK